jgi:hypothetical protein
MGSSRRGCRLASDPRQCCWWREDRRFIVVDARFSGSKASRGMNKRREKCRRRLLPHWLPLGSGLSAGPAFLPARPMVRLLQD